MQAKQEFLININVSLPRDTKEVVIVGVKWDEAICVLEVSLVPLPRAYTMATVLSIEHITVVT